MELVDKNKLYDCAPYIKATGFTQLMLCVLNNDLDNAKHYLLEINVQNSEGWTALHITCRNSKTFSSIEMVEFLLRNDADPNASTNDGYTPLHYASNYSNDTSSLATVEALLRNGANPNAKNNDGWTPLHWAVKYSNRASTISLATVEVLLKNGADPNARTSSDWTPLSIALYFSNKTEYSIFICSLATVKLLLQYNATPVNTATQIIKLEINIENLVEENEKLKRRIETLESEED